MRWTTVAALLALCGGLLGAPARADTITQVLQRSQQQRLDQRGPAATDGEAAARLQASFDRLRSLAPELQDVQLVLVGGDLFAEALFGRRALAASLPVGELPEGERLLMLAHELGHLRLQHWQALAGLFQSLIPGEVRPDTSDPVAAELGARAHLLSHRHEFEADAFGFELVRRLGFGVDNAMSLLMRQGLQFDSATHPATRRRVAQLRVLDSQLAHPHLQAEGESAAALATAPGTTPAASTTR